MRMHKDNISLPRLSPFSAGKLSQRGNRDFLGDKDIRTAAALSVAAMPR
jgi:hypothetical protein